MLALTNYSIFVCIITPLLLLTFMVERRYRAVAGCLCVGLVLCIMASELNTFFLNVLGDSRYVFVTTSITPLVEEILKALPIIFLFYAWDDRIETLLAAAFAIGVGFAIMENVIMMVNDPNDVTLAWAVIRGLCTGLMHAMSTSMVGVALVYLGKRPTTAVVGLFASLALAITFHGTYNALVESDYMQLGFVIPVVFYVFLAIFAIRHRRAEKKKIIK